ncbi:MAG TPA: hypothetical protein VN282_08125 [Pyrinomonadaceae bacterium]|nr:hypothetical protein [Pyrinomonadaceae bacterium]
MSLTRLLLYAAAHALLCLVPVSASAHPATGIVVDARGRVYFSDLENIRRLEPDGRLSIFRPGVRGRHVHELSIDRDGNVYGGNSSWRDAEGNTFHVEQNRHTNVETRILKRTPRGEVSTLAGGAYGHADGRGTRARFRSVGGLAFGPDGSLYVTDAGDLRRVSPDGEVKTLATGLEEQFPDDARAGYGGLMGLAVDAGGNVYVADYGRRRVLKVAADGKVERVVRAEAPWSPAGVALTGDGRVLILEVGFTPPNVLEGPRVRELSPDGSLKVLATVGSKETVATRLTSSNKADVNSTDEHDHNVKPVERALGLYFGLGLVAIGAVAWLKGYVGRSGHA